MRGVWDDAHRRAHRAGANARVGDANIVVDKMASRRCVGVSVTCRHEVRLWQDITGLWIYCTSKHVYYC